MTAEIVAMNKAAVALAADSAVTIETAAGVKIYNTNKLFMLSKFHPVGIMIYGNADLMDIPWESIIKTYRKALGERSFKSLEEYGVHFISYLDKNKTLFPSPAQSAYFSLQARSFLSEIVKEIDEKVEEAVHKGRKISASEIGKITEKIIAENYNSIASLPRLTTLPALFERQILREYRDIINQAIEATFKKLPLSRNERRQLKRICIGLCVQDLPDSSGVVIAGFGDEDIYPALVAYEIEFVVSDRLKYKEQQKIKIGREDNEAVLVPFAQQEMVHNFIAGIAPDYKTVLNEFLSTLFDRYPENLLKNVKNISRKKREELIVDMKKIGTEIAKLLEQDG